MENFGFRVPGGGFRVWGYGWRISGLRLRMVDFGFKVWGYRAVAVEVRGGDELQHFVLQRPVQHCLLSERAVQDDLLNG